MQRLIISAACALALLTSVSVALAQHLYSSNNAEYTLELPSATWRVTQEPDQMHPHSEFTNGDRMDGLLRVRKELVDTGVTPSELARRDQDKLRFQSGYVDGKLEEKFAGNLNGAVYSYEFTYGGKPMLGRIYYLQADPRTIYTLRFTGLRDKLSLIRNQTDMIARSFKLK